VVRTLSLAGQAEPAAAVMAETEAVGPARQHARQLTQEEEAAAARPGLERREPAAPADRA
jgi:hypothetical protein